MQISQQQDALSLNSALDLTLLTHSECDVAIVPSLVRGLLFNTR